jgi:hypothetical protein
MRVIEIEPSQSQMPRNSLRALFFDRRNASYGFHVLIDPKVPGAARRARSGKS